jgi:Lrp/AsnC family leucine-responsive transcriptional regulator
MRVLLDCCSCLSLGDRPVWSVRESTGCIEIVVPDLAQYQQFLVTKLLALPIVREVGSNVAIQTLKAGAPLPLDHLDPAAGA